jgi:hypothetical protein
MVKPTIKNTIFHNLTFRKIVISEISRFERLERLSEKSNQELPSFSIVYACSYVLDLTPILFKLSQRIRGSDIFFYNNNSLILLLPISNDYKPIINFLENIFEDDFDRTLGFTYGSDFKNVKELEKCFENTLNQDEMKIFFNIFSSLY